MSAAVDQFLEMAGCAGAQVKWAHQADLLGVKIGLLGVKIGPLLGEGILYPCRVLGKLSPIL
jgi:hypothetical protein